MEIIFDVTQIDNDLPGIVVLSHGPLAVASLETIRFLTGEQKNMAAVSLDEGDDPDVYGGEIMRILGQFPQGSLVLVDLLGGTPSNVLMTQARASGKEIWAAAGVNVPMLMEAVTMRTENSGRELLDTVLAAGGIFDITAFLEKHK